MSVLSIQLLGGFRVLYDGRPLAGVRSARLQALLAYLVLHRGAPHPRSRLAGIFWPESPDPQARTNLRQLILDLKRALPEPGRFLETAGASLRWRADAPCEIDAWAFEDAAARAATGDGYARGVALYRGDLLPGCYDDWVTPERERLRMMFLTMLEQLVLWEEAHQGHRAAIVYAHRLLDHDPLREETYRLLMRLYTACGDHAGAVRVYHTCATVLERELGIAPGPMTQDAYRCLLHTDLRPAPAPLAVPALIGRAQAWTQILHAWQEAAGGRPQVALVTGEAGIGKTRLAEEGLAYADRQGVATAAARCYAAEGPLALAPVAALLRARPLPPLDPPRRRELARLLPELLPDEPPARGPIGASPDRWQRQRLFDALARTVLATQPQLLVVDDLHWCDEDSLQWLHYLTRHDPGARLLLIVTLRAEEAAPEHPAERILAAWRREGVLTTVELGPLDRQATAQLAAAAAAAELDAATADRIFRETAGNPLFIVELVRAGLLHDHGSGAWQRASRAQALLRERLASLSPAAREVASAAAAIGRAFTVALLARIVGGAPNVVVRAVDELWHRRIIREQGTASYDFCHERLREAAYDGLGRGRRSWLHRHTAEGLELEAWSAAALDAVSAEIAAHWERAGAPDRAAPFYRRAADAARRVFANDLAGGLYERLLPLTSGAERMEVFVALGDVRQLTGAWAQADTCYREALEVASRSGDPAPLARACTALGRFLVQRGRYAEGTRYLAEALRLAEPLDDARALAETVWALGIAYWYQGEHGRALASYRRMRRLARRLGDRRLEAEAIGHVGLVHYDRKELARALACFERYLALARAEGDRLGMVRATGNAGLVHEERGDYGRALACENDALRLAEEIGDRRSVSLNLGNMGVVYRDLGDWAGALACLGTAFAITAEIGDPWHLSILAGHIAWTYALQGRADEAALLLEQVVVIGRRLNTPYHLCKHLYWLGALRHRGRRPGDAADLAGEAFEIATRSGRKDIQLAAHLLRIRACVASDRLPVRAALRECASLLDAWPQERDRAAIHYAAWRLDPAQAHYRREAIGLYRRVHAVTPHVEFRARFATLTGDALPEPPPPPIPPDLARQHAGPSAAEILARVERVAAALDGREARQPAGPPSG